MTLMTMICVIRKQDQTTSSARLCGPLISSNQTDYEYDDFYDKYDDDGTSVDHLQAMCLTLNTVQRIT